MKNERMKLVGEEIKRLRKNADMSQEELARLSGFAGRASISAIEKGKSDISFERLTAIARVFGVNPSRFLDLAVDGKIHYYAEDTINDKDLERVSQLLEKYGISNEHLHIYLELTEDSREKLDAYAHVLIDLQKAEQRKES